MSKDSIIERFEKYKGQFVINDDWEVVRLLAVASDDLDYYWVYWDGVKITWSSCVGSFVPLKGKIDEEYYTNFIRLAYYNHYDLVGLDRDEDDETKRVMWEVMRERAKEKAIDRSDPYDKYITDICWKLI